MTEQELKNLESLWAEATPGPLRVELDTTGHCCLRAPHQRLRTVARVFCDVDAEFIKKAWAVLPELVTEVRRLRRLNESLCERVARQAELLGRRSLKDDAAERLAEAERLLASSRKVVALQAARLEELKRQLGLGA